MQNLLANYRKFRKVSQWQKKHLLSRLLGRQNSLPESITAAQAVAGQEVT